MSWGRGISFCVGGNREMLNFKLHLSGSTVMKWRKYRNWIMDVDMFLLKSLVNIYIILSLEESKNVNKLKMDFSLSFSVK